MALAVRPPLKPMLAKLARELPGDGFVYEPKWDGFRCLAFCDDAAVDLRSRHDRPLARYFPELVEAFAALPSNAFALDGEIVAADFPSLMARLHPAKSRVERLRAETPATFVAFDVLAVGREDLRDLPFTVRRAHLEALLADAPPPLFVTPATTDEARAAQWLQRFEGVVAKHESLPYDAGRRSMVKAFLHRIDDERPDAIVFDLDPGPGAHVVNCCEVALRLRERFPGARVKTSGMLGLHVYAPPDGASYTETKTLARTVAEELAAAGDVITRQSRAEREGRVLVDWLQNDATRSTVAPYSLRAAPWPTVSTPVTWDEVERCAHDRRPELLTFVARDVLDRVERLGDLFRS